MAKAVDTPGTSILRTTTAAKTKVVVCIENKAEMDGKYDSIPTPKPYSSRVLNTAEIKPSAMLVHM